MVRVWRNKEGVRVGLERKKVLDLLKRGESGSRERWLMLGERKRG